MKVLQSSIDKKFCKAHCAAYIERGKKSGRYECRAFTAGTGNCANKDARKKCE